MLDPPDTAPLAPAQCTTNTTFDSSAYYVLHGASDPSRNAFATRLRLAQSDALSCGPSREAYRVHWLPSFRNVRIITVALVENRWSLRTVDFGDRLWTEWRKGDAPTTTVKSLSPFEVRRIREELAAANFWLAVPHRVNPDTMDGRTLVVEGRSGDRYRAITRVNEWDGTERIACVLFNIGGLQIPEYPRCPAPVAGTLSLLPTDYSDATDQSKGDPRRSSRGLQPRRERDEGRNESIR